MSITQPTTDIEIISQASILCGRQGFNSIDSGGSFAQDGSALYQTLVCAELGSNRWRFAQAFQAMGVLSTLTPSFDSWNYYWEMPADLLMLFRLDPMVNYAVFGNRVLTNTNQSLTVIYAKSVPVSKWPATFSMYIVYKLASMMAISVTNSDRMVARINGGADMWESRALFSDGQSTPARSIRSQPYVDVRYSYSTNHRRR